MKIADLKTDDAGRLYLLTFSKIEKYVYTTHFQINFEIYMNIFILAKVGHTDWLTKIKTKEEKGKPLQRTSAKTSSHLIKFKLIASLSSLSPIISIFIELEFL